jgi:hypothetical protein
MRKADRALMLLRHSPSSRVADWPATVWRRVWRMRTRKAGGLPGTNTLHDMTELNKLTLKADRVYRGSVFCGVGFLSVYFHSLSRF